MTNPPHYPPYPNDPTAGGGGPQPEAFGYRAGPPLETGDGTVRIGAVISKGFSLAFRNFLPWLGYLVLGGLVILGVSIAVGIAVGFSLMVYLKPKTPPNAELDMGQALPVFIPLIVIAAIIAIVIASFFSLYMVNGALQVAEARTIGFRDFFRLKHGLATPFWATLVSSIPGLVLGVLFSIPTETMDPEKLAAGGWEARYWIWGLVVLVVYLFLSPFIAFLPYVGVDQPVTVGQAIAASIAIGKKAYGRELLFLIVVGVISGVVGLIPLVGLIIVAPCAQVAMSLAYREVTGGVHEQLTA